MPNQQGVSSITAIASPNQDAGRRRQQDVVAIRSLTLPEGVIAPDVWGRPLAQPAQASISLFLRKGFQTSAGQDALDASTIHYGKLAKRVRELCAESVGISPALGHILDAALQGGQSGCNVERAVIELSLPKAAMHGEMVLYKRNYRVDERGQVQDEELSFCLEKIKVMTLVGINACERTARQPVVANVWVRVAGSNAALASREEFLTHLFGLEQLVAKIVDKTDFETLEALATLVIDAIENSIRQFSLEGVSLEVQLEKPRAILAAEAPAITIIRNCSSPPESATNAA